MRDPLLTNDKLNFARFIDVRRHLLDRRANSMFERSVMHDLVARLLNDPIFAERMPATVSVVGAILRDAGLLRAPIKRRWKCR
jgi:hypothetical protein